MVGFDFSSNNYLKQYLLPFSHFVDAVEPIVRANRSPVDGHLHMGTP